MTATPDEVTRSRPDATPPLTSFAAYEVKLTNHGAGTAIDQVFFYAMTTVYGSAEKAPFFESIGAGCAPLDASKTQIKCAIGKLQAGGSVMFTVLFRAPSAARRSSSIEGHRFESAATPASSPR